MSRLLRLKKSAANQAKTVVTTFFTFDVFIIFLQTVELCEDKSFKKIETVKPFKGAHDRSSQNSSRRGPDGLRSGTDILKF